MILPPRPCARRFTGRSGTHRRPNDTVRSSRRLRLTILPLEDRVVPTLDYLVTGPTEGATVVIIGQNGSISGVTNDQGIVSFGTLPTGWSGIAGTQMWQADVVLPPGVEFYQRDKDFAVGDPYLSGGTYYNTVTFIEGGGVTPFVSCPTGTCPVGTDLLPLSDPNNAGPASAGATVGAGGVRYFDGVFALTAADLEADGFGLPWSQTRSWSNSVNSGDFGVGSLEPVMHFGARAWVTAG